MAIDMTRAGLASETGCNLETIRYYEKIGLMPEPVRTAKGYRIYGAKDVSRISFILRVRDLGFDTRETRDLLELTDDHDYTCSEVREVIVEHLEQVKGRIRDLRKIQRTLLTMVEECDRGEVPNCPVIDSLYG